MKQVEAVVSAVSTVLGDSFTESETVVSDVITPDQKEEVRDIVFDGIVNGDIDFKGDTSDPTAVKRYVNGMVDNHFRKSRLLNGGNVYKPSSSGTKRDPQLRELNRLLKTLPAGSEDAKKVQKHIQLRTEQIKEERAAKSIANTRAQIDTSILPDNLADMLNSDA